MIEKAFILAAGLGTRLRPYTDKAPKPMVHIGGKPIIAHTIDALAAQGVKEIVVNTSHLAHVIEDYLKTIDSPRIIISHENERLETGGGIKKRCIILAMTLFISLMAMRFGKTLKMTMKLP